MCGFSAFHEAAHQGRAAAWLAVVAKKVAVANAGNAQRIRLIAHAVPDGVHGHGFARSRVVVHHAHDAEVADAGAGPEGDLRHGGGHGGIDGGSALQQRL